MQQRQLRLGDVLDDYCPRERRVTNHAIVAMIGPDVKQTRCTTCDTEHEYKHAKVPRQRRKSEAPAALYTQVLANGPKKVTHETVIDEGAQGEASPEYGEAPPNVDSPPVADTEVPAPAAGRRTARCSRGSRVVTARDASDRNSRRTSRRT